MATAGWIEQRLEERLEARQQAARARLIQQHRRKTSGKKRTRSRDVARLMLVASVLTLGILATEIGRKAVTVLHHPTVISIESIG